MPPAKSNIGGNADIWDRDNEIGDGGDSSYFTSQPYPYEYVENFGTSVDINNISYGVVDVANFTTSMDLSSGVLRTPLRTYSMESEEFGTSVNVDSGILRSILIQYSMEPENFTTSVDITSGTLAEILIRYEDWPPENFTTSVDLTGGSLA